MVVPLGTIEIDALAPNEKCDAITFLPANLPEGIAGPANDPIFAMRSPAYLARSAAAARPDGPLWSNKWAAVAMAARGSLGSGYIRLTLG